MIIIIKYRRIVMIIIIARIAWNGSCVSTNWTIVDIILNLYKYIFMCKFSQFPLFIGFHFGKRPRNHSLKQLLLFWKYSDSMRNF